jgi:RHS repeat-associated protein
VFSVKDVRWDEENPIRSIYDNGAQHHYIYDASGERVVKGKTTGQRVFVNGEWKAGSGEMGNFTVYVNPYVVLNSGGYTKHYYIESQRIVSKLGGGWDNNGQGSLKAGNGKVDYVGRHQKVFDGIVKNLKFLGADGQILTAGKSGKVPPGQVNGTGNISEAFRYFFHPDHLGSTSYVTDASGEVFQHLEYTAWGETFVEEHSNTDRTPYLFNGKELDEETELYYYGSRYYDGRTSIWLAIDALADKYPAWSPSSYTLNNPLRYSDPDGRGPNDWVGKKDATGTKITWTWDENIKSEADATAAGYDAYAKPGTIMTNTSGERIRLGENGEVHMKVIGIHSNVDENAGVTDGHAWISVSDVDGTLQNTYSLWPDDHPIFMGTDPTGTISDVRTNTEAPYASAPGNANYYVYLTKQEAKALDDYIMNYDDWGYSHTCADWSRDAFKAATGINMDVDDLLGAETPRELTQTIKEKGGSNTPSTAANNDKKSSSF